MRGSAGPLVMAFGPAGRLTGLGSRLPPIPAPEPLSAANARGAVGAGARRGPRANSAFSWAGKVNCFCFAPSYFVSRSRPSVVPHDAWSHRPRTASGVFLQDEPREKPTTRLHFFRERALALRPRSDAKVWFADWERSPSTGECPLGESLHSAGPQEAPGGHASPL